MSAERVTDCIGNAQRANRADQGSRFDPPAQRVTWRVNCRRAALLILPAECQRSDTASLPATVKRPPPSGVTTTISPVSSDTPVSAEIVDPCETNTRVRRRAARPRARSSRELVRAVSGRPNSFPSDASIFGSPPNASFAVSMHRHHGLDNTRSTGMPRARNASPFCLACCVRPRSGCAAWRTRRDASPEDRQRRES